MITSVGLIELIKLGIAVLISWLFYEYNFNFQPQEISTLAGVLAGSSGTILGFLITAIALMAAVMDRDLMKNLRATGGYSTLIAGSFLCASLFLLLLVFSICLLLPWPGGNWVLLLLTVFVGSWAAIQLASTGISFCRVIMSISKA